jgi:hypothetical protein
VMNSRPFSLEQTVPPPAPLPPPIRTSISELGQHMNIYELLSPYPGRQQRALNEARRISNSPGSSR